MFRLRRMGIDTLSEHVIFIAESAVEAGALGFKPLDRVRVMARRADGGEGAEVSGILNFCLDGGLAPDEIGLSEAAFRDFGHPEGTPVEATHTRAPESVERVLELILEINRQGMAVFMVEQNATLALSIATRGYVLQSGSLVLEGPARELLDSPGVREAYLGQRR